MEFLLELAVGAIQMHLLLCLHRDLALQLRHSFLLQSQLLTHQNLYGLYLLNKLSHLRSSITWLLPAGLPGLLVAGLPGLLVTGLSGVLVRLGGGGLVELMDAHGLGGGLGEELEGVFGFAEVGVGLRFVVVAVEEGFVGGVGGEVCVHLAFELFEECAGAVAPPGGFGSALVGIGPALVLHYN